MAVVLRASLVVVFVLFCHVLWCECVPLIKQKTTTASVDNEDAEADGKEPTQPPKVMPKVKSREGLNYKLKNDAKCKDDIADFCSKEANTGGNYDLLLCLQNQIKEDELSDECHQSLWEYKNLLVHDPKFESPATSLCQEDLKQLDECKTLRPGTGNIVPCLVENKDGITNARCRHVVSKLAQIMFSDYRLLKKFYKYCQDDVKKYECGRQDALEQGDLHTQGSTLECLEEHEVNLTTSCQVSVMRVAELQSKDYHLNRALYYACQDDRERLCATVEAGEGRVYTCLMKKKFDAAMSQECREKLTVKQKVESKDYKANFPFLDSCREAIREHKCLPDGSSPAQLAKVLLCLESAMNDGGKVGGKCRAHMKELQEELMEDYSINPAVVAKCEKEIRDHCGSVTKGGKTIDCLMEKAMEHEEPNNNIEFSRECFNAVSELLRETGAGGDFRVDATLRATCRLPAQHLCPKAKNDMSVLSCLMENLYHKDMGADCQEQLMHLQFFLARDFQLDQALYSACKDDAKQVCRDPHMGNEDKDNSPQGLTLACLYRHILPNRNSNPKVRVSRPCVAEVMRTMHERAASVKLLPQIQMNCVKDLAEHCTNKLEPGEEIKCLQDNYEKLTEKCKGSIKEFTEEESEDIDLDKTLVKHCSEMAKMFCKVKLENNEADEILPCLYEHKYDRTMDRKCRAELVHRELIELKDYTFSAKFKQKCKQDVIKNCPDTKTKPDVIQCLSKHVRAGDVEELDHVISEGCRSQLKVEKLRQAEDVRLDPGLYAVCGEDAKKLCSNLHKEGPAVVLECLKAAERKLSAACKAALFLREKEEVEEPVLDVRLFKVCKAMIKKFCMNVSPEKVLGCLKQHKRDLDMDEQCKAAVFVRQKNALKDIQLSPDLEKACKKDVPKFCHDVRHNNEVIPCLKRNIGKLSEDCEEYVAELEEEAALDYRLNPALAKACENEIAQHCSDKQPGHGEIMECLKDNFKQIKNVICRKEIKEALIEERTDIMADPVLHEACYSMVTKYCDGVSHGRGRILQCLLQVLGDGKIRQKGCKNVLKSRRDMWSSMQIPAPESLTDLASIVGSSPRRNYFFIVFSCALAIIFIGGLISGRLTKRVARETKNR